MTCESESAVILFVVHISLLLLLLLHYPTDMVFVTACQHTVLTWFLHLVSIYLFTSSTDVLLDLGVYYFLLSAFCPSKLDSNC